MALFNDTIDLSDDGSDNTNTAATNQNVTLESEVLEDDGKGECCICLTKLQIGSSVDKWPKCNHCFHKACIEPWIAGHSTCPHCREPLN